MVENIALFVSKYTRYLREYIFNGGEEAILMNAFNELLSISDVYLTEAINIFDIHVRALEEVLNVKRDNDAVQWIYITRANEFFAQILMTIDNNLLTLREQVEKDVLTGLNNRLAMARVLPALVLETQKTGDPFVLVVIDLDNFKKINDTYGHEAGDKVLQEVANAIKSSIRGLDYVFRYGGEEFILVLRNANYEQSFIPLERIRKSIAAREIVISDGKIHVTASLGAASYTEDNPKTIDELIRYADLAMYEAKAAGKNRVVNFRDIKGKLQGKEI
ncbi:diguanylate cyclase (GGDEF) domain-containing protein [Thermosyntropha lipolytica DSM 11003]|uniref:Diguanylate cyclase (GGDEF) domain-containing protein n=1 Tax=Thermosyntropha lipolytica DSM 11003 TaxID=1123382 RepID=A0A1M5LAT2_9FIRM|nr:GGDEF domain-containing protein [Thermosyntropha lipolytica]SHG61523.1 diguanylate cyclase (GGDEF) domain-containing protein [Thermosyntropha lipolytica DSM 11003]